MHMLEVAVLSVVITISPAFVFIGIIYAIAYISGNERFKH